MTLPGLLRVLVLTLLITGVACTNPYSPYELADDVPINWENPDHSVQVANVRAGRKLLSFTPIVPRLADVRRIYVSDPDDSAIEARGMFFVLDDSSGDLYWVIQSPAEVTEEGFEKDIKSEVALCAGAADCIGSWTMVTVRDGRKALLIDRGSQTSAVSWIEDGIQITVMGPRETFSGREAIAAANGI